MKKFIAIILAIVSLMCMVIPASAEETTMWVHSGTLRLRSSRSTSSNNIICSIPDGMPVIVVEDLGTWSKVKYNNHTGYVVDSYLTATAGSATPETVQQAFGLLSSVITYSETKPVTHDIYVYNVQVCLKEAKLYNGALNGNYNEDTYNAVMDYQRNNNLDVDGKIGENTKSALWADYKDLLEDDGIKFLP